MKVFELQGFGFENLKQAERPQPTPGHGQVLMKVKAASLNYRDLLILRGHYNPRMKLPRIPLSDAAGEIVAVGPGVSRVQVGQRVCNLFMPEWVEGEVNEAKARSAMAGSVDGVLAEYVVLPETGVVTTPEHLSDEEASTLPCAAVTAWNGLMEAGRLKPGESVLVQGTGGVSIFALQFARLAGARVILTSSSDEKLERGRSLGATDTINYKKVPEWGDKARELTDGKGVDQVVEVGGAGTLMQSLKAVRMGGSIAMIGVLSGAGECSPTPILMKSARVNGIFVGSGAMFESMNRAIRQHQLKPVVDRVFPFEQAPEALRHLESGAHFGKVVIRL